MVRPSDRVRLLLRELGEKGVDLALVSTPVNLRYLTGVRLETFERFGALLLCVGTGEVTLIVPKLDEGKAITTGLPYITYLDQEGPLEAVRRATSGCSGARVVGFEGNAPIRNLWVLRGVLGGFRDEDIDPVLAGMRIVKDDDELGSIKAAVRAIEEGIRAAREAIRAGVSEAWLARVISNAIAEAGAEPRDVLVQSGPNSAIPHWLPGNRSIQQGDVIVVDVTATHNDYYGDLTRTFMLGEPTTEFNRIYELVREAHDEAIKAVKPGLTGAFIDSVARGVIERNGYGGYFIHRTGHGLGLEVHEEPYISGGYDKPLPRGSVFTIEPGIYLPGRFGVRLESDVAIGLNGEVNVLDMYWPY
ncbi:MAG: Xaa-Pro peptidase family protein [Caldivirga sp.]